MRHAMPAIVAIAILGGCQTENKQPADAYDCVFTPHDLVECNAVEEEEKNPVFD